MVSKALLLLGCAATIVGCGISRSSAAEAPDRDKVQFAELSPEAEKAIEKGLRFLAIKQCLRCLRCLRCLAPHARVSVGYNEA